MTMLTERVLMCDGCDEVETWYSVDDVTELFKRQQEGWTTTVYGTYVDGQFCPLCSKDNESSGKILNGIYLDEIG